VSKESSAAMANMGEKLLVLLTFLFSLVINGLAASGSLSALTIAEVSDKYPTYVTPDRLTFAVWGVIYLLELLLVVAQFGTSERTEKALSKPGCLTTLPVRWRLIMAFLLNALWLPLYTNLQFGKALLVIILYLILLISIYIDVNTVSLQSFWEWVVYGSGIACNLSWVIVATLANKFNLAASYGVGVDQYGVAGTPHLAILLVALLAAKAIVMGTVRSDLAWSLVAVWFLAGLYRQHTYPSNFPQEAMSRTLALVCLWSGCVVSLATVCGLFMSSSNGAFRPNDGAAE